MRRQWAEVSLFALYEITVSLSYVRSDQRCTSWRSFLLHLYVLFKMNLFFGSCLQVLNENAFCLLQKLRDIFALGAKRTPTSSCGTPSTPCRRRASVATPSTASNCVIILNAFPINRNLLVTVFSTAGLTGRLRPRPWFTRSSEGTSGPEVPMLLFQWNIWNNPSEQSCYNSRPLAH